MARKQAYLAWKPKAGPRKTMFFDVVITEQHELTTRITEHAVEKGANVTDHARTEPDRLTLEVFVSNEPILDVGARGGAINSVPLKVEKYTPPLEPTPGSLNAAVGGAISGLASALMGKNEQIKATVLQFSKPFDAVSDTHETLRKLKETAELVEVWTTSHDYGSMLVESIGEKRDASTGTGASFTISFRHVRIVESKLVTAPSPTEARGKKTKKKGEQPPAVAKDEAKKKSWLAAMLKPEKPKLPGLP